MPDPFIAKDWPNPRGKARAADSFIGRAPTQLIGKDTFFGTFGQAPANLDWPNPRGRPFPVALRTWVWSLLQSTLAPVLVAPFVQTDWPNPRGRRHPMPDQQQRSGALAQGTVILPLGRAEKRAPNVARRIDD